MGKDLFGSNGGGWSEIPDVCVLVWGRPGTVEVLVFLLSTVLPVEGEDAGRGT